MPSLDSIPKAQLGKDGPLVPALGFGLMTLGGAYSATIDDEERLKVLDHAYEIGARFWDTSDVYGDVGKLLNKWFKRTGKRDEIFLASKFGLLLDGKTFLGLDSSAEYCKKVCDATLKEIGIDRIDLYYTHRTNPATPIEETVKAMVELKSEGKISHLGLCGVSSATLKRAQAIHPIAAVQTEYSPFVREVETPESTNLLDTCRELGVSLVCYSPLSRGLITGAFTDKSSVSGPDDIRGSSFPWWSEANIDHNAEVVHGFEKLAEKKGCKPSQLALAWLIAQGNDIIPIPGTKSTSRLDENWAALDVNLSPKEVQEITTYIDANPLHGYRSVEAAKALAYVDTKEL